MGPDGARCGGPGCRAGHRYPLDLDRRSIGPAGPRAPGRPPALVGGGSHVAGGVERGRRAAPAHPQLRSRSATRFSGAMGIPVDARAACGGHLARGRDDRGRLHRAPAGPGAGRHMGHRAVAAHLSGAARPPRGDRSGRAGRGVCRARGGESTSATDSSRAPLRPHAGQFAVPQSPGLGIDLDMERISATATWGATHDRPPPPDAGRMSPGTPACPNRRCPGSSTSMPT